MNEFEIIVFDIDSTLTESKQALTPDMAELLCKLLDKYKVGIISGASFKQFEWQVLEKLNCPEEKLKKVYLMPADGTVFCYAGEWKCEYDEPLEEGEKSKILKAFENIFEKAGLDTPDKTYGNLVEDRGAQMNFSALGQDAPPEPKEDWDPDNEKRRKIVEVLERELPEYDFHIGGTTSIEITRIGVDKAYGLKKLMEKLNISKEKVLYVGDKLFPGGNDEAALKLGLECRKVSGPEDTKLVITDLLSRK